MPQISVIVPVYKVEQYLNRCVDSILAQTFTDFELILVDDGSPDNCGAMCDEYAAKDSRIHVIHQKNGGLSAARNAGIDWAFANSDSQWLSFIDSDDWVHPCFLEYLYRAVQETGAKVSACSFKRVEQEELMLEPHYHADKEPWDIFYIDAWAKGVVAWNKLYAKELFTGLRYPIGKINEDEFLTYKVLDRAGDIAVLDSELYYYFQNPSGIMKRQFSRSRLDQTDALLEQCRFAKSRGNMPLYRVCAKRRMGKLAQYHQEASEASSLQSQEKRALLSQMRAEMRSLLLSSGTSVFPFQEDRWYYELAFPKLAWLYWTYRGVLGKIKRIVKK